MTRAVPRPRAAAPLAVSVFEAIADVPGERWAAAVGPGRPLLGAPYLAALEACGRRAGLRFHYALVERSGAPVAACAFQELTITPEDVGGPARWGRALALRLLVCGNLVVTGAPGVAWAAGVRDADAPALALAAVDAVQRRVGGRLGAVVLKDLPAAAAARDALGAAGFRPLPVEPTMTLHLRPGWRSFEDYVSSLRARYRRAVREARALADGIERRPLDAAEAERRVGELDALYARVHARAAFRGPYLGGGYFVALRRGLAAGDFDLVGYFRGGELCAFNTRFRVGERVDSSFFGLDRELATRHALFRNLLLDDLEHAIATGARAVHFGRTTHEIKSAIGAVPEELPCFYRPLHALSAPLCWIVRAAYRPPRWTARRPFRAEGEA